MSTRLGNDARKARRATKGGTSVAKALLVLAVVVALAFLGAFGLAYSGLFNVAADDPHSGAVQSYLDLVRTRSIAARAKGIDVPSLDDPGLVQKGAEHYDAMCSGCHLAPGRKDTEIRSGLYPKPPDLSEKAPASRREAFWIIKHGIKMSGMPAWGASHDDESIWAIVAFLGRLPGLSMEEYAKAVGGASAERHHHAAGADHRPHEGGTHVGTAGGSRGKASGEKHDHGK